MADYLTKRNGIWHYVRRVPDEYRALDLRGIIRHSTKIRVADDPKAVKARKVAKTMNDAAEAYWRGLVDGRSIEARDRYNEARRRARTLGFDYATVSALSERHIIDLLERLDKLVETKAVDDEAVTAALLGGEPEPVLMLSELFDRYKTLVAASLTDLSPDQLRKWANPKKRAIANLIDVIEDKAINRVTRGDALDFREWWQGRVLEGEAEIGTANKDIGHLNKMFRTIERMDRLGLAPVFADLRIEGEKTASRHPYSREFAQEKVLATGALDALNAEARAVVYLISETGLRLSEAVNLNETTIVLDAKVPHVKVRPDGRRMKTDQSERDIPLVGVALMAAHAFPGGFPRYRDKGAGLSAIANKVMRNAGLCPNGETVYSFRHLFEDRLTAVEAPEKLIANLMGHKYSRPKYGAGPSLEQKQEWLQRIALVPPDRI